MADILTVNVSTELRCSLFTKNVAIMSFASKVDSGFRFRLKELFDDSRGQNVQPIKFNVIGDIRVQ